MLINPIIYINTFVSLSFVLGFPPTTVVYVKAMKGKRFRKNGHIVPLCLLYTFLIKKTTTTHTIFGHNVCVSKKS